MSANESESLSYGTVVDWGWTVSSAGGVDLKNVEEFVRSMIEALDLVVLVSGGYGDAYTYKVVTRAQAEQMRAEHVRRNQAAVR